MQGIFNPHSLAMLACWRHGPHSFARDDGHGGKMAYEHARHRRRLWLGQHSEGSLAPTGNPTGNAAGHRKPDRKPDRKQVPAQQETIFSNARRQETDRKLKPAADTIFFFRIAQQHRRARGGQFARIAVLR